MKIKFKKKINPQYLLIDENLVFEFLKIILNYFKTNKIIIFYLFFEKI